MSATVAIAHTKEKHRSQERVLALVREALAHLGGMESFVTPGQTVLIKPNQTVYYSAEEGCTTDPLVVGALIRLARDAGAARVQVAESSGGFFNSLECMRITGMAALAEREGAELIDLGSDRVPNRLVKVPNGKVLSQVPLPGPLLDADVIIAAPKAKNHHIEPITGALKLWVGAVNQNWRNYNHGDADMIARFVDIMTVTKPDLCVVDALICGEGDGPSPTSRAGRAVSWHPPTPWRPTSASAACSATTGRSSGSLKKPKSAGSASASPSPTWASRSKLCVSRRGPATTIPAICPSTFCWAKA